MQTATDKCPLKNLMAADAHTGPVRVMVSKLQLQLTRYSKPPTNSDFKVYTTVSELLW